ncbi:MAG: hypothetical protein PUP93_34525 [Rhizonema sp. NSF051]|nr:hypothetical protein [Rhizonema sp. NSF051]
MLNPEFVDIEVAIAIHDDLAVQIPDFKEEVGDLGFYESIQGFGVAIRLKPWPSLLLTETLREREASPTASL